MHRAIVDHENERSVEDFPSHNQDAAGVARMVTYLERLADRLRVWREAEAAKAVVLKAAEGGDKDRGAYPAADWVEFNGDANVLAGLI